MLIRDEKSHAHLVNSRDKLNFFHQKKCTLGQKMSAFEAYCKTIQNPSRLLRLAFKVRDEISALAGVKKINGFSPARDNEPPKKGQFLDFFLVEFISHNELTLSSRDKHLSVVVSIRLQDNEAGQTTLLITTSVQTHNAFGRLYMIPVAPAHRVIVRGMLSKVAAPGG